MLREELADLNAFLTVAEEGSFTRAAARLNRSQSSLSHTIRRLESRLGVRLLTRTTRSVSPTTAGERLLETLRPALASIDAQLSALADFRDKPAGIIRLTASEHATNTVLWPVLKEFLPAYPDIHLEISVDSSFADVVADRFDAGVRLGEALAKDMIAVRIGPDLRMAVVGSPAYFAARPKPLAPHDLAEHKCINLRLATDGALYVWEFDQDDRELHVRVEGQMTTNNINTVILAAEAGLGLGFVMENHVDRQLASGRLIRVLNDWCRPFAGYHLYYPSRRHPSAAFALLVEALRYRAPSGRR